jgi:hypothetical protein
MKARYIILFSVLLAGCGKDADKLNTPDINNTVSTPVVTATVKSDGVVADNYTNAEIQLQVKLDTGLSRSFVLTTDKGSFSNDSKSVTVFAGSDGLASAYLKDNRAELVNVTITNIEINYSKTISVQFVAALPDQILIEPDAAVVANSASAKVSIKATLLRKTGTVSVSQALTFGDLTTTGNKSIGIFLNSTLSNADGIVTVQYFLQDTTYKGYVNISGTIIDGTKTISGTSRILVK